MIQIYYGTGKGKTTAAIGQAIRGVGAGMKVAFIQFLKPDKSSELKILKKIDNLDIYIINTNTKFLWEIDDLSEIKKECKAGMKLIKRFLERKEYDMLILDEILHLIENDLMTETELIELLKNRKNEIIMTGRKIGDELEKIADIVTEMRKIKHSYDKGEKSKKGIEF